MLIHESKYGQSAITRLMSQQKNDANDTVNFEKKLTNT